jgi:hypothetical protein
MRSPTVNCNERVDENSKKLYCRNCRRGMYYWSRKKAGEATEYIKQLVKRQDRISNHKDRKALRDET